MWFIDSEKFMFHSYFERKMTRFCHLILLISLTLISRPLISAAPHSFKI